METRDQFLSLIDRLKQPILTIIGENSPPYSLKEMVAISDLDNRQTVRLSGTLGMAEEYADLVAPIIQEFC